MPDPLHPGIWDHADWKALLSVPNTPAAHPNGQQWHALIRILSWEFQRVAELEARLAKVEAQPGTRLAEVPESVVAGFFLLEDGKYTLACRKDGEIVLLDAVERAILERRKELSK